MGYSYKNTKLKPAGKNASIIKQLRKNYAVALAYLRDTGSSVFYIDELVLPLSEFNEFVVDRENQNGEYHEDDDLNITMFVSPRKVIKYSIEKFPKVFSDFRRFLE